MKRRPGADQNFVFFLSKSFRPADKIAYDIYIIIYIVKHE